MRVCEDVLRCKMILCLGREGRFGLAEVQTWNPAVEELLRLSGGTSWTFHWFLLKFDLTASLEAFVHVFRPLDRETSMKLCGLLRKTSAHTPTGPFRYGDARQ